MVCCRDHCLPFIITLPVSVPAVLKAARKWSKRIGTVFNMDTGETYKFLKIVSKNIFIKSENIL